MNRCWRFICNLSLLSVLLTAAAIFGTPSSQARPRNSDVIPAALLESSITSADYSEAGSAFRLDPDSGVRSLLEQAVSQFAWLDESAVDSWKTAPYLESPTRGVAALSLQVLKVRWQL